MNRYVLRRIFQYVVLFTFLIVLTQLVYKWGSQSYVDYINAHENDLEWVEENIKLEDDYKIGNLVKVFNMPGNLTVSNENYNNIINKKIKSLLLNQYSVESPLLIYNPYREDKNVLYIYFHTGNRYYAQYYASTESIVVQGIDTLDYVDFTDESGNLVQTSRHYYKIDSLVPGKKNNIIIRILDENMNVIDAENFILNVPSVKN